MRIIGRFTKARAMATRCCSPPESSSGIRSSLPSRPDQVEHLGHHRFTWLRGSPDHLERERHVLVHGLVRQQPEVLEHGADLAAERRHLPVGEPGQVLAGDVDLPRVGALLRSTSRRKVDLPDPDAPTRKTNSPFSMSTETSSSAGRVWFGYCFVTFSKRITRTGSLELARARAAGRTCWPGECTSPRGEPAVRRPQGERALRRGISAGAGRRGGAGAHRPAAPRRAAPAGRS